MSDLTDTTNDKELELLAHISERAGSDGHVHQRDLARVIGMSLGMTNAIVKRLARKGYLTIRKVNNRNIAYAVTPEGVDAIAKRSYRYLRRTVKNIVLYKQAIEELVIDAKRSGHHRVVLAGESDLAFIVEHLCSKHGLEFAQTGADGGSDGAFTLYGEAVASAADGDGCTGRAYLSEVLAARM